MRAVAAVIRLTLLPKTPACVVFKGRLPVVVCPCFIGTRLNVAGDDGGVPGEWILLPAVVVGNLGILVD